MKLRLDGELNEIKKTIAFLSGVMNPAGAKMQIVSSSKFYPNRENEFGPNKQGRVYLEVVAP